MTSSRSSPEVVVATLAATFTFYVDANEYLLLSVAMTTASMQVRAMIGCQLIINTTCRHHTVIVRPTFLVHD